MSALRRFVSRPDFRTSPLRAIFRRIIWRLRWLLTDKAWVLELANGMKIEAPKGGAGALIYYQGQSEPEVSALLTRALKPGMTFWDIGAHIGEYTLLASSMVGPGGQVEAFEPQPAMFNLLKSNIRRNHLKSVKCHDVAVADSIATALLNLPSEPSIAAIQRSATGAPTVEVRTTTLDHVANITGTLPNVIKVDVEGAEALVLGGASQLLNAPATHAPLWVMEFEPANCTAFGYRASDLLSTFRSHGLVTYWLTPDGQCELIHDPAPPASVRTIVATKGARP